MKCKECGQDLPEVRFFVRKDGEYICLFGDGYRTTSFMGIMSHIRKHKIMLIKTKQDMKLK